MTIGLTGRQAPLPHRGKMRMAPAPGFEPGTAAVRSGACKMIRYTLRACIGKMVGHPGYAPGVSRSQAERISIFLVPDENGGRDG